MAVSHQVLQVGTRCDLQQLLYHKIGPLQPRQTPGGGTAAAAAT
jgi:hypothetical protein